MLVRMICTAINPARHRCLGLFQGFSQISFIIIIHYFLCYYSQIGWCCLQDETPWHDLEIDAASEAGGDIRNGSRKGQLSCQVNEEFLPMKAFHQTKKQTKKRTKRKAFYHWKDKICNNKR